MVRFFVRRSDLVIVRVCHATTCALGEPLGVAIKGYGTGILIIVIVLRTCLLFALRRSRSTPPVYSSSPLTLVTLILCWGYST